MPMTRSAAMPVDPDLREWLLGAVPALRAFAHSLTDDDARGDNLVQDTLLHAWTGAGGIARDQVTAWLFGLLRARFYAEPRLPPSRWDEACPDARRSDPRVEVVQFREAMRRLPDPQREALILVGGQHFSYGEAAAICGVAVGTLKSRVRRARARLAAELDRLAQP